MAPHAADEAGGDGQPEERGVPTDMAAPARRVSFPRPPQFEDARAEREYLKGRLAAAFRIFAKYGFDEGVAGHITLRDPVRPDCFWVNPFGVAFALMRRSDLILVTHAGQVVDGGGVRRLNTAAYTIHAAVHAARPDVVCAAHAHSLHGRTWCSLGRPLDALTQDACAFHDDHVVYDRFRGVVLAEHEGRDIARCLGPRKAALLQNHGLLTVGASVEEAVFWFVSLDKCCHSQLMAEAAAASRGQRPLVIADDDARRTAATVGTPRAGWFSALPLFDVVHRETGGDYLQ